MRSSSERDSDSDAGCFAVDSSDSSDDGGVRLVGGDRRKFQRLRRIFLSKPQPSRTTSPLQSKTPTKATRRCSSVESGDSSDDEESAAVRHLHGGRASHANLRVDEQGRQQSQQSASTGLLQEEIDRQMRALCEQVELLAARRDSSAKQRESELRRAIEELQLVKARQRQVLETQTRVIEQSFALRLEVLERQHEAAVAETCRELRAAVQQQREECESAVLSAVKQLQLQTQADLLGEMTPNRVDALATPGLEHRRGDRDAWTFRERVRCSTTRPSPVSPMARQRLKLQAFEQKLKSLPQASVHRVTSQRQRETPKITVDTTGVGCDPSLGDRSLWQPAPLSPLRSSLSKWTRGVSRETFRVNGRRSVGSEDNNGKEEAVVDNGTLTRRYLRPEEERELLRLRNSIGLAKDWMETNIHDS